MKPVAEWDEAYIMNLPPGEHDWVEFKNSELLDTTMSWVKQEDVLNELAKQVSAFANSGGGTIVYGIEDKSRKVSHGGIPLKMKGKSTTKEWLEDVIPNLVEFPLQKFNVYEVHNSSSGGDIASGKCLILVDIVDSDTAPHQSARDKRYYARVGGKSLPISHRHVVDIMGRAKHPKLALTSVNIVQNINKDKTVAGFHWSAEFTNIGKVYANYVNGKILIPNFMFQEEYNYKKIRVANDKEYREHLFDNVHKDLVDERKHPRYGWEEKFYVTRYDPILPKLSMKIHVDLLASNMYEPTLWGTEKIYWEVYADNAPLETGEFDLKDTKQEFYYFS